jgi:protein-L-isoaspartate O-methyltransferase
MEFTARPLALQSALVADGHVMIKISLWPASHSLLSLRPKMTPYEVGAASGFSSAVHSALLDAA